MRLSDFSQANTAAMDVTQLAAHRDLVSELQRHLTAAGLLDPPSDGGLGPVTQWALSEFCRYRDLPYDGALTAEIAAALLAPDVGETLPLRPGDGLAQRLLSALAARNYWFSRHPKCLNIVYVEGMDPDGTANANAPDQFNDSRFLLRIDEDGLPALVEAWEATTEPGTPAVQNPENPAGAARIAFGQYKSWIVGIHRRGTTSEHEALVQAADVAVHRDLNKDNSRAGDRVFTGTFGINQHWGFDLPKNKVGKASAGCLVGRTKAGHVAFMGRLKHDARFDASKAYRFMTAILPAAEVP